MDTNALEEILVVYLGVEGSPNFPMVGTGPSTFPLRGDISDLYVKNHTSDGEFATTGESQLSVPLSN